MCLAFFVALQVMAIYRNILQHCRVTGIEGMTIYVSKPGNCRSLGQN